ncbi:caspase family protein [Streptomyces stelliscabiei]|uniref:caspase family protein n=1 Tax=Streptomyces stelliscabiei TaxID=146820 RepID=UPI002FF0BF8A
MTVRLPDPRGSRAVLIGTSRYDSDLPDLLAVRNNLEVLQELLTSDAFGGFPRERCEVVQDAPDPRAVCATIREAAMTATDTLLVYFSGHGVLNEQLKLHLALTGTDESDLRWTSIPFEAIREILEASPCPNKILVLDCCNSGRVLDTLMGNDPASPEVLTIRGTYILTSSANAPSYAPVGERYTAFTGEFLHLLRDGLPNGPDLLTLSTLYDPLTKSLSRRGYPEPRQQSSDGHARLGLVRNRQAGAPAEAVTSEGDGTVAGHLPGRETRFGPSRTFHRVRNWSIGLPISLALLGAQMALLPNTDTLNWANPRHVVALLPMLSFFALTQVLGKRHPADYSLVLSSDGLEVQYGHSEHYSLPWHRIGRCWIRQRPATRLRGRRYELMVRPMPGVFPQTASWRSAGPHQTDVEGTIQFADLRRLRTTPETVEAALATYAGTAWTPSPDLAAQRSLLFDQEKVFTVSRFLLGVTAPLAALLGWKFIPSGAFVQPLALVMSPVSLVLCLSFFGVAWFAASRCVRPVTLAVNAAGLTLSRGRAETAYAWAEIERIALVNWPPGARHLGLVTIRPTKSAAGRGRDRTSRLLPKLSPGTLTLCLLQEVTLDQGLLEDALARFADEEQLALPGEAWQWTSSEASAPPGIGVTFRGRQPAKVSGLVCAGLCAPFMTAVQFDGLPRMLHWWHFIEDLVLVPLMVFGIAVYILAGMHHVCLHVGPWGLTLKTFGKQRLQIPWGDVDRVGVVARSRPDEHTLVLWPRHGAAVSRSVLLLLPYRHGGLRLLALEHHRVDVSPDNLDQAMARYAGRRHTHMPALRPPTPKKNRPHRL